VGPVLQVVTKRRSSCRRFNEAGNIADLIRAAVGAVRQAALSAWK
jgi:hypothetical protein